MRVRRSLTDSELNNESTYGANTMNHTKSILIATALAAAASLSFAQGTDTSKAADPQAQAPAAKAEQPTGKQTTQKSSHKHTTTAKSSHTKKHHSKEAKTSS